LAVFGEYEREMISKRTKDALAARKARGFTLGNVANLNQGQSDIAVQNKAKAAAEAERLRPIFDQARRDGHATVRGICEYLNDRGYVTERGSSWHPTSVARVLARLEGRREAAAVT
jgi:DNA invertase Pin-like site-specific DNA recombinase